MVESKNRVFSLVQMHCKYLEGLRIEPENLGAELGMTMVLHTNTRKLDFHPHIHAVIPGGAWALTGFEPLPLMKSEPESARQGVS